MNRHGNWTKRYFQFFIAVVSALLLTGCIQVTQEYQLNPDGSGKVALKQMFSKQQLTMMSSFGGGKVSKKEVFEREAKKVILTSSKGISAWKDITLSYDEEKEEGTLSAVGYFKDIRTAKIGSGSMQGQVITVNEDGSIKIVSTPKNPAEGKVVEDKKLSDEELKAAIEKERAAMAMQKNQLQLMMGTLSITMRHRFPGNLKTVKGFKKVDDTTAEMFITGKDMLKAIDEIAKDDAIMAKIVKAPNNPIKQHRTQQAILKKLFGTPGPFVIESAPAEKPIFDFAKESKEAAAYFEKWKKENTPAAPTPAPMGVPGVAPGTQP